MTTRSALCLWLALLPGCAREPPWGEEGLEPLPPAIRVPGDAGTDAADSADASPRPTVEICGNGVDDNGNGLIDEGCSCDLGANQHCMDGSPMHIGVGACGRGLQQCEGTTPADAHWGACTGQSEPIPEVCDGIDNDCNGVVDDGCACTVPAQSCYGGTLATLGVGACHGGHLVCFPPGEIPIPNACVGDVTPTQEICDGIDNDCNGQVDDIPERCDGVDNNCNGIVDEGCPATNPALTRFMGSVGSGILPGDRQSQYVMGTSSVTCLGGLRSVEVTWGHYQCAPDPPVSCGGDAQPLFDGSTWNCAPCAVIIQFGVMYGGERVCASLPMLDCPPGTKPTFDATQRDWVCAPPCDDNQYDEAVYGLLQACIPC